jgi:hypothetical protein
MSTFLKSSEDIGSLDDGTPELRGRAAIARLLYEIVPPNTDDLGRIVGRPPLVGPPPRYSPPDLFSGAIFSPIALPLDLRCIRVALSRSREAVAQRTGVVRTA